jgi:hypothetical protein
VRLSSEINRTCGSSGRMPALQVGSPKFKPQYTKKRKKTRKERKKLK